jgi:hypothetical protein
MTRAQFDDVTVTMRERAAESSGSWTVFFYPKSAHMAIESLRRDRTVYPLVALSTDFDYYKWVHGPGFAKEWVKFAKSIRNVPSRYIFHGKIRGRGDSVLSAIHDETGKEYASRADPGGGRVYHEPAAQKLTYYAYDRLIE